MKQNEKPKFNKKPVIEDFFVQTGEVDFQGGYEPTGYFDEEAYKKELEKWDKEYYPNGDKR